MFLLVAYYIAFEKREESYSLVSRGAILSPSLLGLFLDLFSDVSN